MLNIGQYTQLQMVNYINHPDYVPSEKMEYVTIITLPVTEGPKHAAFCNFSSVKYFLLLLLLLWFITFFL